VSASGSKALLTGETRKLAEHWAETRKSWQDQKAAAFAETYLEDLFSRVNTTVRAIEELEQLLHKVHADCD
jgi:hypothetical protein